MYLATRPLTVGGRKVQAGDPVPEADKWQYSVLQAHLNLGWIVKKDGEPSEKQPEASQPEPQQAPPQAAKKKAKKKGA